MSKPPGELTQTEVAQKNDILNGYHGILNNPFQPHVVARTRPVAYQYSVVMKYLDNLIAAGDRQFTQYTVESLTDATLFYIHAANILGTRPQQVPPRGTIRAKSFAELNAPLLDSKGNVVIGPNGKPVRGVDEMGNALVDLEAQFPFNFADPSPQGQNGDQGQSLFGIGRTLYFCIPPNDKLLGYWDTVADRLFKIRHCMDIEGVVRPLALFDPPLDPGMLVKAAAAGIDIGSIVSGLSQPIRPVRCQVLIQKAIELASEVRGLGNALLSAVDSAPDVLALDRRELTEENFDDAYQALVGEYDKTIATQSFSQLKLAGGGSPANQSGATGTGNLFLNANEDAELNSHLPTARDTRTAASALNTIAGVLTFFPDLNAHLAFWGLGAAAQVFGGIKMSDALKIGAEILQTVAAWEQDQAGMAAKTAGYQRRTDDWMLQANLAARELMQIGRQLLTSLIAEQVAHHEYLNIQTQIAQSQEVRQFLEEKFTNEELYGWMQGEVSRLFFEYYRFAVDTARKAERTMKQELMRPEVDATDFIQFNYWDAGRKGLLSDHAPRLLAATRSACAGQPQTHRGV